MLMICFTFGLEHQYPEGWGELQSELDWKLIKESESDSTIGYLNNLQNEFVDLMSKKGDK